MERKHILTRDDYVTSIVRGHIYADTIFHSKRTHSTVKEHILQQENTF